MEKGFVILTETELENLCGQFFDKGYYGALYQTDKIDKSTEIYSSCKNELLNKQSKLIERTIAVISKDTNDFQYWKNTNNLKGDGLELVERFKIKGTTYFCVCHTSHLIAISLDDIILTDYVKQHPESYFEIITLANINLKNS